MRFTLAVMALLMLAGCSTAPKPLVPDTVQGPASYVCYSSTSSTPAEIRAIAERQCGKSGMAVSGLLGNSFTPFRCGLLTPNVAAYQCGAPVR